MKRRARKRVFAKKKSEGKKDIAICSRPLKTARASLPLFGTFLVLANGIDATSRTSPGAQPLTYIGSPQ
jgi:hypothetical protein